MKRAIPAALTAVLLALAACGVDGQPVPPSQADEEEARPGVTITGSAGFGIARSR